MVLVADDAADPQPTEKLSKRERKRRSKHKGDPIGDLSLLTRADCSDCRKTIYLKVDDYGIDEKGDPICCLCWEKSYGPYYTGFMG